MLCLDDQSTFKSHKNESYSFLIYPKFLINVFLAGTSCIHWKCGSFNTTIVQNAKFMLIEECHAIERINFLGNFRLYGSLKAPCDFHFKFFICTVSIYSSKNIIDPIWYSLLVCIMFSNINDRSSFFTSIMFGWGERWALNDQKLNFSWRHFFCLL